jgi:hypothetical protein
MPVSFGIGVEGSPNEITIEEWITMISALYRAAMDLPVDVDGLIHLFILNFRDARSY